MLMNRFRANIIKTLVLVLALVYSNAGALGTRRCYDVESTSIDVDLKSQQRRSINSSYRKLNYFACL